ncbi:MAG: D-sedoheptulose 7-phosphate isomerase [Ignavibacteria bacterium]|jgi:D-sedoheptulose 7-phosphate isomerase|nr:D-sedoheptulose 7-phosphate isomerase [Ignavibacteria bacterium]MDH7528551.1 D-sedoheptulose 7-phosphate isomerase [Ignavibacteria bacterium]
MDKSKFIKESLNESANLKRQILENCEQDILRAVDLLVNAFKSGKKLLLIGNGGSAADCQHIATELMIRLSHHIKRPALPAIALTTDTSNLTAGGNDIGYENVFARNVEGLGNEGDVLWAISTSGNSPNIIKAIEMAKSKKMYVLGLSGLTGGKMSNLCDVIIKVPSENTQRIQEGHLTIEHIICEMVELELYCN